MSGQLWDGQTFCIPGRLFSVAGSTAHITEADNVCQPVGDVSGAVGNVGGPPGQPPTPPLIAGHDTEPPAGIG